ncbi:hypothetical protein A5871_002132, partial [Enterococcus sp. 2F9_DIV0599]
YKKMKLEKKYKCYIKPQNKFLPNYSNI